MAHLSKTRHLFAFTSPRTIEKIILKYDYLKKFEGQKWTTKNPRWIFMKIYFIRFLKVKAKSKRYWIKGKEIELQELQKLLGFVDLKPIIQLSTDVGRQLVTGKRSQQ